MHLTRRHFMAGAGAFCAATVCGCTVNPATGRNTFTALQGVEQDVAIGRREHPKLIKAFGGVYEDRQLQSYVDAIGARLAAQSEFPQLPYIFTIANSPVVNAFALPGGPVTITRGLLALCDSEAELASVLGHEIGHVTARHSAERQGRQILAQVGLTALAITTGSSQLADAAGFGAQAFLQHYSRDQEMEADTLGARYMDRAGYDVDAMPAFLDTLRDQSVVESRMLGLSGDEVDDFNMMATHPRTADRARAALRIAEAAQRTDATVNREAFLNAVNGILFGDDPKQGLVFNRTFTHPDLRFTFSVPEGFRLINTEQKVLARNQHGDMIIFDMVRARSRNPRNYLAREWAGGAPLSELGTLTVNGMPAATATARGRSGNAVVDIRLVAIRHDANQVYRFMFVTRPNNTRRLAEELRRTTHSLRELTAAEAANIQPLRLTVTRVRPGETVAALSTGMPYGRFNEDWFRLLNDLAPGEDVQAGQVVKIIEGQGRTAA